MAYTAAWRSRMLVRQMRRLIPDGPELVSVTARFLRPLDWPIVLESGVMRNGKTVTSARATASSNSGTSVEAHATFSGTPASNTPRVAVVVTCGEVDDEYVLLIVDRTRSQQAVSANLVDVAGPGHHGLVSSDDMRAALTACLRPAGDYGKR